MRHARLFLPIAALIAFVAIAMSPACATTKGADLAACAPTSALIDLAETALKTGDYVAELGKLVAQTSTCVVNKSVAAVVDKYSSGAKAAASDPAPGVIVERGRTWLATHAEHARIHFRTWRTLNQVPSPFIPARANC